MYEIKLLNVSTADGAVPTWILLNCLQVLSTCQALVAASPASSTHQTIESFALLYNVAKDKLYELGRKCGLLPGSVIGSAELHCVVTISSGVTECEDDSAPRPTPVDKLKEALSTSQAFTKHYLVWLTNAKTFCVFYRQERQNSNQFVVLFIGTQ